MNNKFDFETNFKKLLKETNVLTCSEKDLTLLNNNSGSSANSVSAFGDKIVSDADTDMKLIHEADALRVEKPKLPEKIKTKEKTEYKPVQAKYDNNSKFWPDEPMEIDEEVFNQAMNNLLPKGKKSSLKDNGKYFVQQAKDPKRTKPADPFLLAGISMHESALGTFGMAVDGRNNIAGLSGLKFKTVEKSISRLAGTVDLRNTEGLDSVSKLANSGKYCKKTVAKVWREKVPVHANALRAEYNRLLAEKYGEN